jgi:hypothetical protein
MSKKGWIKTKSKLPSPLNDVLLFDGEDLYIGFFDDLKDYFIINGGCWGIDEIKCWHEIDYPKIEDDRPNC